MTLTESAHRELAVPPPLRAVELTMSDGAPIRLRQYGRPGRRRLVLSHGNGLAINAYLPFWLPLADEFELVLIDMRNHGENPLHDGAAHEWPRLAQDMGEIFHGIQNAFGAAPAVGVFHSLSAIAAVLHDLAAGPSWSALALFDPPLYPPASHPLQAIQHADMTEMAQRALGRPAHYAQPAQFAAQLARRSAFRRWVPGAHLLFARSTLRPAGHGHWVLRCPGELEARIYAGNLDATIWPRLPTLAQPKVLIGADPACPDAGPPSQICRAAHDELHIDYTMIPDTTHFLQIEKPQACGNALIHFLQRNGMH
jgi:pimeloyl-ACP methyl ester carboxylesterase